MSDLTDALGETEGQGGAAPSSQDRGADTSSQARDTGQSRDEGGRFARREATPPAADDGKRGQEQRQEPQKQDQGQDDPAKAAAAREDARERRQTEFFRDMGTLHKELVQKINPPKAAEPEQVPEFWDDPNQATDHRIKGALDARFDPVMQRMQALTVHYSARAAEAEFGKEKLQAAIGALQEVRQQNPQLFAHLEQQANQSLDPVGDVVRWHQRQQQEAALIRIGGDPEKWMDGELQKIAADPTGREKLLALLQGGTAEDGAKPVVQGREHRPQQQQERVALPPSLSKLPTGRSQPGGDMSDAALFSYATH